MYYQIDQDPAWSGQVTEWPTSEKTFNVGVVGAGKRAASYFRSIPTDLKSRIRLTAIVEPADGNRERFVSLFADEQVNHYADAAEMFACESLDAIILASPNKYHAQDAMLAVAAGVHVLLEKPVATTVAECEQLWRAAQLATSPVRIAVGFVLRYTPFYSRVKDIISSGQLGSILAIDADENLGTDLTALFHKGWRRDDRLSGGFMVEKCCHDFDILNWLMGSPVDRVFSIAKRTHFLPQSAHGRHGRFQEVSTRAIDDADFGDREISEAFFTAGQGSPYDFPADSPDHQAVLLSFEGGELSSFMACMGQPRTTRRMRVFGTNGSLEGNIDDSTITVHRPHDRGNGWTVEHLTVDAPKHDHHGGDAALGETFWRGVANETTSVRAGLREGIEAVLVAIAAQESSTSGEAVNVRALRERVFRRVADTCFEGAV